MFYRDGSEFAGSSDGLLPFSCEDEKTSPKQCFSFTWYQGHLHGRNGFWPIVAPKIDISPAARPIFSCLIVTNLVAGGNQMPWGQDNVMKRSNKLNPFALPNFTKLHETGPAWGIEIPKIDKPCVTNQPTDVFSPYNISRVKDVKNDLAC